MSIINLDRVAANLKVLRVSNGLKQKEIAEYLFINRSRYSQIENGNAMINLELLLRLSNFYGITPDDILFSELKLFNDSHTNTT